MRHADVMPICKVISACQYGFSFLDKTQFVVKLFSFENPK